MNSRTAHIASAILCQILFSFIVKFAINMLNRQYIKMLSKRFFSVCHFCDSSTCANAKLIRNFSFKMFRLSAINEPVGIFSLPTDQNNVIVSPTISVQREFYYRNRTIRFKFNWILNWHEFGGDTLLPVSAKMEFPRRNNQLRQHYCLLLFSTIFRLLLLWIYFTCRWQFTVSYLPLKLQRGIVGEW